MTSSKSATTGEKPKPCPFCGVEPLRDKRDGFVRHPYREGFACPMNEDRPIVFLLSEWNQRAEIAKSGGVAGQEKREITGEEGLDLATPTPQDVRALLERASPTPWRRSVFHDHKVIAQSRGDAMICDCTNICFTYPSEQEANAELIVYAVNYLTATLPTGRSEADKGEKAQKAIALTRVCLWRLREEKRAIVDSHGADAVPAYLNRCITTLSCFETPSVLGKQVEAREQTEWAWRKTSENPPTEKDANQYGNVFTLAGIMDWRFVIARKMGFWMPIPPLPAEAPEKKEERK